MIDKIELSIIIPTKDRPTILAQTLQKAIVATTNATVEIIVINDGNEIKQKVEHPSIQYHKNPKKGVTTARNYGATLAQSDLLLFLDDDMWMTKATVEGIKALQQKNFFDNNTLCLNWVYPDELIEQCKKTKTGRFYLKNNYHTMLGRSRLNTNSFQEIIKSDGIGSASFLIKKDIFNRIGGYNESIQFQGEDIDMSSKLVLNSIGINTYTPITCFHNDNTISTIASYTKRQYSGYLSQAKAEQQGLIQKTNQNDLKSKFYQLLLPFESIIIFIFNTLPNKKMFDTISFKLIGILGALQKVKAYKRNNL